LFLLTLDPRSLSETSHLPIGPLVTLGFAAFIVTHVVRANAIVARATDVELLYQEPV
jgi:hypothetical protein